MTHHMNFWGFHHSIFAGNRKPVSSIRTQANQENPKAEFYIPTVANRMIQEEKIRLKVLTSDSQWYGVTYTDDKATVQAALAKLSY